MDVSSRPEGGPGRSVLREVPFLRLWTGTTASRLATWSMPAGSGTRGSRGSLDPAGLGVVLACQAVGFLAAVPIAGSSPIGTRGVSWFGAPAWPRPWRWWWSPAGWGVRRRSHHVGATGASIARAPVPGCCPSSPTASARPAATRWFLAGLAALTTVIATGYSVTAVALPLVSRDRFGSEVLLAGALTGYTAGALLEPWQ